MVEWKKFLRVSAATLMGFSLGISDPSHRSFNDARVESFIDSGSVTLELGKRFPRIGIVRPNSVTCLDYRAQLLPKSTTNVEVNLHPCDHKESSSKKGIILFRRNNDDLSIRVNWINGAIEDITQISNSSP